MATPVSNSSFDVEAYIGNYQGFTRLKRMAFIASHNSTLKPDVLRVAIDEVRKTTNTALYLELITMAADTPGASARDDAWVEAEDKRASQRLEKLENDLSQHKTSLVKESIRVRACHTQRLAAVARLWADPRRAESGPPRCAESGPPRCADGAQRPGRLPLGARRIRDGAQVLRAHARLLHDVEAHHHDVPQRHPGLYPNGQLHARGKLHHKG